MSPEEVQIEVLLNRTWVSGGDNIFPWGADGVSLKLFPSSPIDIVVAHAGRRASSSTKLEVKAVYTHVRAKKAYRKTFPSPLLEILGIWTWRKKILKMIHSIKKRFRYLVITTFSLKFLRYQLKSI